MEPQIPALLGGIAALIIGVVVLIKRSAIASMNAGAQRAFMGRQGERVAKWSTPTQVVIVGIFALVFGSALIVLSFSGLEF